MSKFSKRKAVHQFDINGTFIHRWKGYKIVAQTLGFTTDQLRWALKTGKVLNNSIWKKEE